MINGLVAGRLFGEAEQRVDKANKPFTVAKVRATTTDGDLTRIEASGNVYFVTPDQSMRGDRATYTLSSEEVVVTGDVILTQGQNVLTGGRLVYNVRTEAARMEGGSTASGNRIRGVFYPQGSSN